MLFPLSEKFLSSVLHPIFKKTHDLVQASPSFIKLPLCHLPMSKPEKSCTCYVAYLSPTFQGERL